MRQKMIDKPRVFVYRKGLIADQEDTRDSHFHRLYEIFLVRRGLLRVVAGNRESGVEVGSIVIIPKGISHKIIYDCEECERDMIQFSLDYINPTIGAKLHRFFPNNVFIPRTQLAQSTIYNIFDEIERESERNDDYADEMFKAYVNILLTLVLRNPQFQSRLEMGGTRVTSQGINETVKYIVEHFNEPLTLESLARRASVSTSHYSRSFREATGYGFKEYLNMVRIGEARRLLLGTVMSVVDVAYACGFNDSNYFSTCFKQIHGESPLSFRVSHCVENKKTEYDHRSYVQDPAGTRHSVLRITSDRTESVVGSRTTHIVAVTTQDVPYKRVSFRIFVPSRGSNRMLGDFYTDPGFPVMYQIYVKVGQERGDQNYLTMLHLRSLNRKEPDDTDGKFAVVDGYDFVFSTSATGNIPVSETSSKCRLSLDRWYEVTLEYDFNNKKSPLCTLSIDGKFVETTNAFYLYKEGIRYQPKGSFSLQFCTLMRTCGTIYIDGMAYSESSPEESQTNQ